MTGRKDIAAKALRSAVMRMQKIAPGMLPVYMAADCRPTDDPTVTVRAGVDGGSTVLEYNVNFVSSLEPTLLGAIVYMQCLKIALHHCDTRKRDPLDMLKLASDIVVAEYARKLVDTTVGKNMEIVNSLFPSYWNYWPVLQKHGFVPETDLTLEKLFDIFKEENMSGHGSGNDSTEDAGGKSRETEKNTSGPGERSEHSKEGSKEDTGKSGEASTADRERDGGENTEPSGTESGKGEGDDAGEEASNPGTEPPAASDTESDGDGEGTPGEGGESSGGGDGEGEPGDDPGDTAGDGASGEAHNGDAAGDEGDTGESGEDTDGGTSGEGIPDDDFGKMARYFSLTNAGSDLEKWGQDEVARDTTTAKVLEAFDKGMFDRMRGPLPAMLKDANRVKVDREAIFRKFMASVQDDEYEDSWSRRNRKFIRYGMIAPGHIYKETQRILFCVDVSRSMYQDDAISNCLRVMEGVCDGLSVDIVYWDAVCSPVFTTPRSIREMTIFGGGWTDPDCVLRKLGPERYKYDGLVFLTDCMFSWKEPPKPRQIMILRSHGTYDFPDWCMFRDDLENFIGM